MFSFEDMMKQLDSLKNMFFEENNFDKELFKENGEIKGDEGKQKKDDNFY